MTEKRYVVASWRYVFSLETVCNQPEVSTTSGSNAMTQTGPLMTQISEKWESHINLDTNWNIKMPDA